MRGLKKLRIPFLRFQFFDSLADHILKNICIKKIIGYLFQKGPKGLIIMPGVLPERPYRAVPGLSCRIEQKACDVFSAHRLIIFSYKISGYDKRLPYGNVTVIVRALIMPAAPIIQPINHRMGYFCVSVIITKVFYFIYNVTKRRGKNLCAAGVQKHQTRSC